MNLDRGLIKQQAKALMRGKVIKLFVVTFVISICVSLIGSIGAAITASTGTSNIVNGDSNNYAQDYDYFNDFNEDAFDSADQFNSFTGEVRPVDYVIGEDNNRSASLGAIVSFFSTLGSIALIVLSPLLISLTGYYVQFIRGKDGDLDDDIKSVFKNTFNNSYGYKLGLYIIKSVCIYFLSLLFIVPGIVFGYSSRYAFQIMCDNPKIKPMQAIRLSKKIIQGNRTELFILDLSFFPWMLLSVFIFPLIYILPYYYTTDALYYENFRIRALQQGRVTEDDFLSDEERMNKYAQQGYSQYQNPNQYYNPNVNVGSQPSYYNPTSNDAEQCENNAEQNANNAQQNVNNAGNVEFTQQSYNSNSVEFNQTSDNVTYKYESAPVVNETESTPQNQQPVEKTENDNATIIIDGVPVDDNSKDSQNEL